MKPVGTQVFIYTALNLAEYYRRDTTLQPAEKSRQEVLRYIDMGTLEELEELAAKNGTATMNTLSDYLVRVTAVAQ